MGYKEIDNNDIKSFGRLIIYAAYLEKNDGLTPEEYTGVFEDLARPLKNVFSDDALNSKIYYLIKCDYPGAEEKAAINRTKDYIKLLKYANEMKRLTEFSLEIYTSIDDPKYIYKLLDKARSFDEQELIYDVKRYQSKEEKDSIIEEIDYLLNQNVNFKEIVNFLLKKCQSDSIRQYNLPYIRSKTVKKALKLFDY